MYRVQVKQDEQKLLWRIMMCWIFNFFTAHKLKHSKIILESMFFQTADIKAYFFLYTYKHMKFLKN